VLAPRTQPARPVAYAWAAAAGVAAVTLVGWVAFSTLQTEPVALAKAGEATPVRGVTMGARAVPADYLIAHQEYSPTTQIQGVGPHLRSVAVPAAEVRP
jgi:sigma-E factor negative regulatory protein RseA